MQAAALLGSFLAEHADRVARKAGKSLRWELDESPSREHRRLAAPAYVGELGALLLERGDDAARLWGEVVRHHGGDHFQARHDIGDLVREFKALHAAILEEWTRRAGEVPVEVAQLLSECIAEGAAAAASDFVRRLRGEQVEFRESALIETILEHLDEGILLIEADFTFSFATRPAYDLLGPGIASLLGRSLDDPALGQLFVELEARDLDGDPFLPENLPAAQTLRTRRAPPPTLLRIKRGGVERILELNAIPILAEDEASQARGELRGVISTVRDRTADIRKSEELRTANRELGELHTRLLHRSRSQAMGEVAAGAAHALNNLLNSMQLRLRLLRESPGPEQVEGIGRTLGDIAALVSRLQQFASQRSAGPSEPVSLDPLVREALALVRPEGVRAGEGAIQVQVELGAPPRVRANASELRELLVSLLLYAREQLAQGGTLRIQTRPDAAGGDCVLAYRPRAAAPAPRNETWLEPFFEADAPTTLALATASAREALARWGGGLSTRALEGGGAEFVLSFGPAELPSTIERPAPPRTDSRSRRVLVIDDDPDNAIMLAEVLAAEGHHTDTASTAREAVEKWQREPFDVALVDLLMPDMSGTEIAAQLLRIRPTATIALVTGWELDEQQRRAAPVHAVFRKPVDLAQLLAFLTPAPAAVQQPPAP